MLRVHWLHLTSKKKINQCNGPSSPNGCWIVVLSQSVRSTSVHWCVWAFLQSVWHCPENLPLGQLQRWGDLDHPCAQFDAEPSGSRIHPLPDWWVQFFHLSYTWTVPICYQNPSGYQEMVASFQHQDRRRIVRFREFLKPMTIFCKHKSLSKSSEVAYTPCYIWLNHSFLFVLIIKISTLFSLVNLITFLSSEWIILSFCFDRKKIEHDPHLILCFGAERSEAIWLIS